VIDELIKRTQQGEEQAFAELYSKYKSKVHCICWGVTRNTDDADDLTQEVFLQLFKKINCFDGRSAFGTWLYRVALNVCLMRKRKLRYREEGVQFQSLNVMLEDGEVTWEFAFRDRALEHTVDRLVLCDAIANLTPGFHAVFVLHELQGLQHNEISERLGISTGTSKSQLNKARKRMRQFITRMDA
jgi:RNA polymerase sigma-70 factor, ECF subfamily